MSAVERVRALVFPIVEPAGVELYDVEYEAGILRVTLDREGGIDVDTIGELAGVISAALDRQDPFPGQRYLLEVTSPGIERKLRTPQHFAKQLGEDVNVKVRTPIDGVRRFTGRLVSADDTGVEVAVDQVGATVTRRLEYSEIESARTIFHWGEESPKSTHKKAATG